MLTGTDFIGIVPDDVPVGYNRGSFPGEDRIFDVARLWQIEEARGSVPECIYWYALEELCPLAGADPPKTRGSTPVPIARPVRRPGCRPM